MFKEIGEWSQRNFGEQVSKVNGAKLGSIAPLLGIAEEFFELDDADEGSPESLDALADIGIYLIDFCNREGVEFDLCIDDVEYESPLSGFQQLFHAVLKRHQGIRGFDNDELYKETITKAVKSIWESLNLTCIEEHGCPIVEAVKETWDKIVSKRTWR